MKKEILSCILVALFFLTGCGERRFWLSSPPDYRADHLAEVSVIWERPMPESNIVEVVSWTTTNQLVLLDMQKMLSASAWRSLSTLVVYHPTRIFLVTQSGEEWEMHMFGFDQPRELAMYNRKDIGKSGVISCGPTFISNLITNMSAEKGYLVDLTSDFMHREKWASASRVWAESAAKLSARFPWIDGSKKGHL
ncbi:MAG: hypothetical protein WCO77_13390 [bacterium]